MTDQHDLHPDVDTWHQRLAELADRHRRRTEARRTLRRQLAAARSAGLRARWAAKQASPYPEVSPMSTKPCGCTTDHLCPQHLDALTHAQRRQWLREHPATGRRQHTTQDPDRTPRP